MRLHLAQSDDDDDDDEGKTKKIYRANVKMRVRGAVTPRCSDHAKAPSLPPSLRRPLLALNITTVFGFLVRYGPSRREEEEE